MMKSEALHCLESHLAIGHINVQEFSALHDLLALFNRLIKLVKRTYSGEIDRRSGATLIAEEACDARKHLESFHRLYSHTAAECQSVATSRHDFDSSSTQDREKMRVIRADFKNDIERLPGTKDLFELISAHFDDNIYHPFLESHRRHPNHPIWELNTELTAVYVGLIELYDLVATAEEWAAQIDKKLRIFTAECRRACDEHAEGLALKQGNEDFAGSSTSASPFLSQIRSGSMTGSSIIHKKISYDTPSHPYGVGRSFSAIEEAVNRRPVAAKANYTTHEAEEVPLVVPQAGCMARRIGHVVPRVFTGSFSELEESMRKLRVPKPGTSPTLQIITTDPKIPIMESATTPVSCVTPLSSVPPSPGQLLRRREALIEREVEFQDRVINGEIIRSRRPVDDGELAGAARKQVMEVPIFKNETLTRWLNESPPEERNASPLIKLLL